MVNKGEILNKVIKAYENETYQKIITSILEGIDSGEWSKTELFNSIQDDIEQLQTLAENIDYINSFDEVDE